MSIANRYLRTAGSGVAAKVVTAISAIAVLWLLNRLLGKADFGSFMFVLAIAKIGAQIVASGFAQVLLYRVSRLGDDTGDDRSRRMLGTAVMYGTALACVVSLSLFFSAEAVAGLAVNEALALWLPAAAVIIPFEVLRTIVPAWHRAVQRVNTAIFYREVVPALLLPAILGALLLVGPDSVSPALTATAYILAYLLPVAVLMLLWPGSFQPGQSVFSRDDVIYGSKMLLTGLASQPAKQVDILIVGFLASPETTAEYVLATRVAQLLLLGKNVFARLLVPRIGYLLERGDNAALRGEYDVVRTLSFTLAMIAAAAVMGLGDTLLQFFGDYTASSALLLLLVGVLVRVATGQSGSYIAMAGYAGWSLVVAVVGVVANLGLAILWVPTHGVNGAALAFLVAVLLQNGLAVFVAWYLDRFQTVDGPTLVSLLIMGGIVLSVALLEVPGWVGSALVFVLLTGLVYVYRRPLASLWRSSALSRRG